MNTFAANPIFNSYKSPRTAQAKAEREATWFEEAGCFGWQILADQDGTHRIYIITKGDES